MAEELRDISDNVDQELTNKAIMSAEHDRQDGSVRLFFTDRTYVIVKIETNESLPFPQLSVTLNETEKV